MKIKNIFNKWFWKDLWYKIDCCICPRNEWAHKIIGNQWKDKVSLVPDFLFASIEHFVDKNGEDCFGVIDWNKSSKEHKKVARQIKQIYKWIKLERPVILEKLDNSYPEKPEGMEWLDWINDNSVPYRIKYKETIRLEKLIDKNDAKFLKMIIDCRGHLWT